MKLELAMIRPDTHTSRYAVCTPTAFFGLAVSRIGMQKWGPVEKSNPSRR
jgi:hypothetical protein